MSHDLIEVPSWDTPITVPDNAEGAVAETVDDPFQKIANRLLYLFAIISASGSGALKLRRATDFTAAKGITYAYDGEIVEVDQKGLYMYEAASSAAEELPWILRPTTPPGNSGNGRLIHALNGVRATAKGLATLDNATRLVQDTYNMPLGMASFKTTSASAILSTTSISYVDTAATVSGNHNAGDEILIHGDFLKHTSGAGHIRICVTENGGADIPLAETERPINSTDSGSGTHATPFSPFARRTVVTAGTVVVKVQIQSDSGTTYLYGPGTLLMQGIRP